MSHLHNIIVTKNIEAEATFALNLLELIYNNVESLNDLKDVVGSVSDSIAHKYKEALREEGRSGITTDLIDLICDSESDDIVEVLHTILSLHPKALHQFIASKYKELKLAMIESSQAIVADLESVI